MATSSPSTAQAIAGGPKPALPNQSEVVQSKRDLASWWKQFKRSDKKPQDQAGTRTCFGRKTRSGIGTAPLDLLLPYTLLHYNSNANSDAATAPGIFGIPLHTSIRYANVAISLFNDEGQSYIYGYVPIVVAKCGVFLKEKGT